MGETRNTPATDRDTQVGVVAEVVQNNTDNTHVGYRVLLAMDHCHVGLHYNQGSHTVQLIAATERKQIDETTAGDLDGTCAQEVCGVDNSIRGSMGRVHRKESSVPVGEDPS